MNELSPRQQWLKEYAERYGDKRLDGLSTRTLNVLYNEGIKYEDLPHLPRLTALRFANFGKKSLKELAEWLDAKGIEHRLYPPPAVVNAQPRCPHCGKPL